MTRAVILFDRFAIWYFTNEATKWKGRVFVTLPLACFCTIAQWEAIARTYLHFFPLR